MDSGKRGQELETEHCVCVFVVVLLGTKIQQWKKRGVKRGTKETNPTTVTSLYTYFKKDV